MNTEKTGHTPGPWRTGDMYNTVFGPKNGNPCPEIIAYIHKGSRANARLIAAAPDLLEACERIQEQIFEQGFVNIHEVARLGAAIERARGTE